MNIIDKIECLEIPTRSPLTALHYINDTFPENTDYNVLIQQLMETEEQYPEEYAKFFFQYLVTTAIKEQGVVLDEVKWIAKDKTDNYFSRLETDLKFLKATSEVEYNKPKLTKKERAVQIIKNNDVPRKEIISMFMEQLDMSKAGATTYYYTIKREMK